MLRKIALLFATTLMFTAVACDSGEEPVEDRAAELPDAEAPGDVDGPHGSHGRHGRFNPAQKLCAELECSDAQAAEIAELFASRHEGRGEAHEARKAARATAHQAIADAFRTDEFDASVLDRVAPDRERDGVDHEAAMVELATKLHAILTPEQRAALADDIEAGGPMLFGRHHGPKGKHGKHGKRGPEGEAERDPAERLAAAVDRFCAPLSCTAEQQTQLTATFAGVHEAKREARAEREHSKPDFTPLAAAFRADTLDQAALRAALAVGKDHMGELEAAHGEQLKVALAEIHDILTPEQRGIVADEIASEGLRALMGRGEKHHGKRGHGKRGGAKVDAD